ncbi:substrate-binding domain-containing protein [Dyella silvatica]|uniref:substrate-binding domain-containing protein n=1 Tax=Dyella silvatica TaxID=2992128 RepID=UPI0022540FB9|nr:substrate-binding domain-containing protein [Dyella silvatica]
MTSTRFGARTVHALALVVSLGMSAHTPLAYAGTALVGGGATAPALGLLGTTDNQMQTSPSSSSLLGIYSTQTGNPQTSYCMNGSGLGKQILTGGGATMPPVSVQAPCINGTTITTITKGFGAQALGRTDLLWPSFVVSDAPLTVVEYGNYITNHASSNPIQFPMAAESIAITFTKGNMQSLNLTDAQLCKLFSGQITDWSDPQLAATVPAGLSGPIQIVYDSDSSGTTFGLSNHLATVCPGTQQQHFIADPLFTKVVSLYFPSWSGTPSLPSTWIARSGDQNVVNTILSTDGTLGYAGTADVINVLGLYATVNGFDPVVDFASQGNGFYTISTADIVYNQVMNGTDPASGRPNYAAITPSPTTQCIVLVTPQSYAKAQGSGYPIVSIVYLLANAQGNKADRPSLQNLMWAPYNTTVTRNSALTSFGPYTGLALLTTSFTKWQIQNCIN